MNMQPPHTKVHLSFNFKSFATQSVNWIKNLEGDPPNQKKKKILKTVDHVVCTVVSYTKKQWWLASEGL
jgi:hypothetical protein